ncbi:MAG UNVERIFIED_CONTAM: hypothetical protein LVR18_32725 [Planctomycetaceae bacterium]|jgi:hypothetical protein
MRSFLKARTLLTFPCLLLVALSFGSLLPHVSAQDEAPNSPLSLIQEGTRPLLTITFSGADRFLRKSQYIFDAAEHPSVHQQLQDFLKLLSTISKVSTARNRLGSWDICL